MVQLLDLKEFKTPTSDTFIASCMTTLYDLVSSDASRGKHIYCNFPLKDEREIRLIERQLIKREIISVTFANKNVFLINESYEHE